MLTRFTPVLRLTIFLLLSSGLHGGVVFYDWASAPDNSSVVAVPVSVSLLPAAKSFQSMVKPEPVQVPVPPPSQKTARPAVKPKAAAPVKTTKKAMIKKPLDADIVKKVVADSPAPEVVCLSPQDVVTEESSVDAAAKRAPVEENPALTSLETGDIQIDENTSSFASSLVEAVPHYRSNPLPEYPRLARRKHWEGVVWLLVDVSAAGLVKALNVEESSGHKLLDRAAERTVKRWQFSPATRGGLPVSSQVRIPVRFRLEDG